MKHNTTGHSRQARQTQAGRYTHRQARQMQAVQQAAEQAGKATGFDALIQNVEQAINGRQADTGEKVLKLSAGITAAVLKRVYDPRAFASLTADDVDDSGCNKEILQLRMELKQAVNGLITQAQTVNDSVHFDFDRVQAAVLEQAQAELKKVRRQAKKGQATAKQVQAAEQAARQAGKAETVRSATYEQARQARQAAVMDGYTCTDIERKQDTVPQTETTLADGLPLVFTAAEQILRQARRQAEQSAFFTVSYMDVDGRQHSERYETRQAAERAAEQAQAAVQVTGASKVPFSFNRSYSVFTIDRRVYIQSADSAAWSHKQTATGTEVKKAVRREIANNRALVTDPRNKYCYLAEMVQATADENGEQLAVETIYKRQMKYMQAVDMVTYSGHSGRRQATTGGASVNEHTVKTYSKLIEDMNLTPSQSEVLKYRMQGYGYKAIAQARGVSDKAVKKAVQQIQIKAACAVVDADTSKRRTQAQKAELTQKYMETRVQAEKDRAAYLQAEQAQEREEMERALQALEQNYICTGKARQAARQAITAENMNRLHAQAEQATGYKVVTQQAARQAVAWYDTEQAAQQAAQVTGGTIEVDMQTVYIVTAADGRRETYETQQAAEQAAQQAGKQLWSVEYNDSKKRRRYICTDSAEQAEKVKSLVRAYRDAQQAEKGAQAAKQAAEQATVQEHKAGTEQAAKRAVYARQAARQAQAQAEQARAALYGYRRQAAGKAATSAQTHAQLMQDKAQRQAADFQKRARAGRDSDVIVRVERRPQAVTVQAVTNWWYKVTWMQAAGETHSGIYADRAQAKQAAQRTAGAGRCKVVKV